MTKHHTGDYVCPECDQPNPHHARGLCNKCYHRWLNGSQARSNGESPDVWDAGWVRDGLIMRPAYNVRSWQT